jgi:hypothetical protein
MAGVQDGCTVIIRTTRSTRISTILVLTITGTDTDITTRIIRITIIKTTRTNPEAVPITEDVPAVLPICLQAIQQPISLKTTLPTAVQIPEVNGIQTEVTEAVAAAPVEVQAEAAGAATEVHRVVVVVPEEDKPLIYS